jgi:hypothetical protein
LLAIVTLVASCGGIEFDSEAGSNLGDEAATPPTTCECRPPETAPPPTTTTTTLPTPSASVVGLPSAPIAPRSGQSAVWTGTEMIVWGGVELNWSLREEQHILSDGARYDPKQQAWLKFAGPSRAQGALFRGRTNHVAVWTGSEMIVWGGLGEHYEDLADGARFSPGDRVSSTTSEWRPMAPAPFPAPEMVEGVWTGRELVLVMGMSRDRATDDLVTAAAAYDPATDQWRMLAPPPLPTEFGAKLVWVGSSVALVRATGFGRNPTVPQPLVELYNPRTDSWSVVEDFQLDIETNLTAVSTGRELLVFVGASHTRDATSVAIDVRSGRVRPIAESPFEVNAWGPVWSGDEALFWTQDGGGAYDPTNDHWRTFPAPPHVDYRVDAQVVWADDKLIAWGAGKAPVRTKGPVDLTEAPVDFGATYTPAHEER